MTTIRGRLMAVAATLAAVLAPRLAAACATCVSSAYGDRGFNWGYSVLLVAPFLVMVVIAGVLSWSAGYRLRWRRVAPSSPPAIAAGPITANEERP
jgi:hypothetical protein